MPVWGVVKRPCPSRAADGRQRGSTFSFVPRERSHQRVVEQVVTFPAPHEGEDRRGPGVTQSHGHSAMYA